MFTLMCTRNFERELPTRSGSFLPFAAGISDSRKYSGDNMSSCHDADGKDGVQDVAGFYDDGKDACAEGCTFPEVIQQCQSSFLLDLFRSDSGGGGDGKERVEEHCCDDDKEKYICTESCSLVNNVQQGEAPSDIAMCSNLRDGEDDEDVNDIDDIEREIYAEGYALLQVVRRWKASRTINAGISQESGNGTSHGCGVSQNLEHSYVMEEQVTSRVPHVHNDVSVSEGTKSCTGADSTLILQLSAEEWNQVKPQGDKKGVNAFKAWYEMLVTKLLNNRVFCVLSFKNSYSRNPNSRKKRSSLLTSTGRCTHSGCMTFKFKCWLNVDGTARVTVDMYGQINHTSSPRFRRTTELEFSKIAEALSTKQPEEVYEKLIFHSNPDMLLSRNFNQVKSMHVIRKIKSLVQSSRNLHSNIHTELQMMYNVWQEADQYSEVKGFIQQITTEPFQVIMFCEQQVTLFLSQDFPVLHFDATGCIVRNFEGVRKRLLLYSLVIANVTSGEPPVALLEMLSSSHDTCSIRAMLQRFHHGVSLINNQGISFMLPSCLVVTDFSWALIHAVLFDVVMMDVHRYLLLTYESVVNHKQWNKSSGVFLCSNHVVKNFARKTARFFGSSTKSRNLLMHCFVLMQYSLNFSDIIGILQDIVTVFSSETCCERVVQAECRLLEKIATSKCFEKCSKVIEIDGCAADLEHDIQGQDAVDLEPCCTGIRRRSPWNQYWQQKTSHLYDIGNGKVDLDCEENPHYFPEATKYLLSQWMPIFPLWGHCVVSLFGAMPASWYSNCEVENWFAIVKRRQLRSTSAGCRLRVTQFVRQQYDLVKTKVMRFNLADDIGIPKCRKRKREHPAHARESWGKRRAAYASNKLLPGMCRSTAKLFSRSTKSGIALKLSNIS